MGRYLSAYLCSSAANKTSRSFCKIRHLTILLRRCPHPPERSPCLRAHRASPPASSYSFLFTRKVAVLSLGRVREARRVQIVRFNSSSGRNAAEAEAPVGTVEEPRSDPTAVGGRLGIPFSRLSAHANFYFKRKEVAPVAAAPGCPGRSETGALELPREDPGERRVPEPASSPRGDAALRLFHVSSLATAFGQSYSYVANHINSTFSRTFSQVPAGREAQERPPSASTPGKMKRRRRQRGVASSEGLEGRRAISGSSQAAVRADAPPSSWEEGYRQFARHINRYFGAKAAGERGESAGERPPGAPQQQRRREEGVAPPPRGLFHHSRHTTGFGESYFQTAGHINQYFRGQSEADEDVHRDPAETEPPPPPTPRKSVSFMDCLLHPTSAIPHLLGAYFNAGPSTRAGEPQPAVTSTRRVLTQKLVLGHREAELRTRGLIGGLWEASSPEAVTACAEALNRHLVCHPACKAVMWQEKTAVLLLRKRRAYGEHQALQSALRETLALIGYTDPVKGHGIRVLSIDGGGTRGVVPLQVLKLLEAETGKKIHQLFDYICGVSTGAVLAFMLGLARFSLEECADMYRRFGSEVFRQNPLVGTVKMGWNHSYYDTQTWETILQEKLGDKVLIKTARDELSPKVSAVSAVVNWGTSPKAFVFRNYNHKPGSLSRYAGGSNCHMWQAVRASSAAPGYFQEFLLHSDIHQDGGIILNNPCSLAVHESRLLWPKQPFQCVLSLGTGRYDNAKRTPGTSTSLRAKISSLICSATDTEGVHTLLDDLLAPDVYFRFNPMLSSLVSLDESRPRALDQLQRDTQVYLERNRPKLARLCLVLAAERSAIRRTQDWMSERAWEVKQRWV